MARIGLDGDGVLLDYNRQFGLVFMRYFQTVLEIADPKAYHATRYWGVERPEPDSGFWTHFDETAWDNMPEMAGAVEACGALVAAGHELVCVSSMPKHRAEARLANLRALGFPISQMIATGPAAIEGDNPKREAIEALDLDWFVDDELRKLKHLGKVKCVLVDPGHSDCPNQGQPRDYLAMTVGSVAEFARRLLAMEAKPVARTLTC